MSEALDKTITKGFCTNWTACREADDCLSNCDIGPGPDDMVEAQGAPEVSETVFLGAITAEHAVIISGSEQEISEVPRREVLVGA